MFILSSRYEAFGLVVIEALTLEVPVLATENHATNKIIKHKEIGYIIKNFDFFYHQTHQRENIMGIVAPEQYSIKDDFITEYPLGSKIKVVNKDIKVDLNLRYMFNIVNINIPIYPRKIESKKKELEKNKNIFKNELFLAKQISNVYIADLLF